MFALRTAPKVVVTCVIYTMFGSLIASGSTRNESTLPKLLQKTEQKLTIDSSPNPRYIQLAQTTAVVNSDSDKTFRALTGNVIDAIQNLEKATDPNVSDTMPNSGNAAERLRSAISELAKHADKSGKTTDYLTKLIDEAVDSTGVEIPVALRGADGKLDTTLLIMSVVSRSLKTESSEADSSYLNALNEEAISDGVPEKAAIKTAPKLIDKPKFVIVASGQTLGGIAWKYYGDSFHFLKIFEANRNQLESPNRIRAGMKLKLP